MPLEEEGQWRHRARGACRCAVALLTGQCVQVIVIMQLQHKDCVGGIFTRCSSATCPALSISSYRPLDRLE